MTTDATGTLDEAYERLHATGPEFDGWLSNHGPMAAEAMVRHGHAGSVHRWLDGYMRRLEEFPRDSTPIGEDWREALGDPRRVADWTAYFRREVTRQPWRRVLGTWWPRLLPGVAAAATHGVIRVGHAVRALLADGDDAVHVTELAHGLAYWAARWQPVPGAAAGLGLPAAGLVAYGEAGHILPVTTPDVPGDLGIDRFQVTDWLCAASEACISCRAAASCASDRRLADHTAANISSATTTATSQASKVIRAPAATLKIGNQRWNHCSANASAREAPAD